jgi:hypothetical protein
MHSYIYVIIRSILRTIYALLHFYHMKNRSFLLTFPMYLIHTCTSHACYQVHDLNSSGQLHYPIYVFFIRTYTFTYFFHLHVCSYAMIYVNIKNFMCLHLYIYTHYNYDSTNLMHYFS